MVWLAERVSERPLQEDSSGWLYLFRVFPDNGDADGGYPCRFNYPLDQPHGLITDGSAGGKQDTVHTLFL